MTTTNTKNGNCTTGTTDCTTTTSYGGGTATATCTTMTAGTTCSVNEITTPGCYVCNWNGSLLRVNDNCFDSSNNTWFSFWSNDSLTCTFICDNPYASIGECRETAKACGVSCNF